MILWTAVLLLAVHLLLVNVATAGPLVCMYYEWREGRGCAAAGRAGRRLAWWGIWALLAGVMTGVLLGWARWSPELKGSLARLESRIWYGQLEIGFSLALMILHAVWWRNAESRGRLWRGLVLLLAGTNLLYHFPTLFAVLSHLQGSEVSAAPISSADFRALLAEPYVLAHSLHVSLACFAVTGALMIWAAGRASEDEEAALAKPAARLALGCTVLQLPVGLWLMLEYPKALQQRLMGGDTPTTAAFMLSLLLALSLMHHLAVVSFRNDSPASRRWSVVLTAAIVVLMSAALTLSRA